MLPAGLAKLRTSAVKEISTVTAVATLAFAASMTVGNTCIAVLTATVCSVGHFANYCTFHVIATRILS